MDSFLLEVLKLTSQKGIEHHGKRQKIIERHRISQNIVTESHRRLKKAMESYRILQKVIECHRISQNTVIEKSQKVIEGQRRPWKSSIFWNTGTILLKQLFCHGFLQGFCITLFCRVCLEPQPFIHFVHFEHFLSNFKELYVLLQSCKH